MDTAAIEFVLEKARGTVRQLLRKAGLPDTLMQDLLHDGAVILIRKIQDNTYDVAESAPATYLVGICRLLIANAVRLKKQPPSQPLENNAEIGDESVARYFEHKEQKEVLEHLLARLGAPCNQLLRLTYLDGYRDEEILQLKLTTYTSADSLRSTRSQCFKKLKALARAGKTTAQQDAS